MNWPFVHRYFCMLIWLNQLVTVGLSVSLTREIGRFEDVAADFGNDVIFGPRQTVDVDSIHVRRHVLQHHTFH